MSNPEISVIIPVYNVEDYIVGCLDSVVNQDLDRDIEIIVVDDKGNDRSMELAREYALSVDRQGCRFVFIEHPQNKGQAAARNNGVRVAKGEYLFFIDSDDTIQPECLRVLYEAARETGEKIVQGQTRHVATNGCLIQAEINVAPGVVSGVDLWEIGARWYPVCWNKLIDRETFINNELWFAEGFFYEDLYWPILVAFSQISVQIVPELTYNYLHRSTSTTHTLGVHHIDSFIKLIEHTSILIRSKNLSKSGCRDMVMAYYERIRSVAIDYVYKYSVDENSRKRLFSSLKARNLTSLWSIITNRCISFRICTKVMPLYFGTLGHQFIKIKSNIIQWIKRNCR